jgi:hypothetical protein
MLLLVTNIQIIAFNAYNNSFEPVGDALFLNAYSGTVAKMTVYNSCAEVKQIPFKFYLITNEVRHEAFSAN